MSYKLLINIGQLVGVSSTQNPLRGNDLKNLSIIENAWLLVENDRIHSFGSMQQMTVVVKPEQVIDINQQTILPTWVDSHTHLVYAESREAEFVQKIQGATYAEIAASGGGILNSASKIAQIDEEELYERSQIRLNELIKLGTGAIEIKSGYGLSTEDELKMLRVIKRLKEVNDIPIKATFLGAHAYPLKFKENHSAYIDLIIHEMLPEIERLKLADYMDVFCEKGFFEIEESRRLLNAGLKHGLVPKIHANQLNCFGAVELGVELGAVSVDHLESMDDASIKALGGSTTIGTLLPGAAYFLRMSYPPARDLINAGAVLALASDFNPGSCPSGNMNQMVSMACIQMKLLPSEAINAATINGAFAMGVHQEVGSIAVGKKANLILYAKMPSLSYIPYSFGSNLIEAVMISGSFI